MKYLLIAAGMVLAGCASSGDNAGDAPATPAPQVETTEAAPVVSPIGDDPVVEDVGPSVVADEFGAADSAGGEAQPVTQSLPDAGEILLSLFEFDGAIVVGYSPFESQGTNCLEARLTGPDEATVVATAAISPGADCDGFSPFSTPGTPGETIECRDIRFLITTIDVASIDEAESVLLATVTAPGLPDGVTWLGGTFTGPIDEVSIPTVDFDESDCAPATVELALDSDVPVYDGPVTQQVGIQEIDEGGVPASFTTIGAVSDQIRQYTQDPFASFTWGEIVVLDERRVEAVHEDGRYLTFVVVGGDGPHNIEICVWPQRPADTACA